MWKHRSVLVTGGASFIGSHLVDSLLRKGAVVTVADDFSSGKLENLEYPLRQRGRGTWRSENLTVHRVDLKDRASTRKMMRDTETVFHLAAQHGGRGYIHTHPAECCTNMALDQLVFEEAWRANVDRVCFASSACVYPHYLQEEAGSSYLLKEEDADPFVRDRAFADLEYGWCLHGGTLVLTRGGLKEVQYVQVGDHVLSKDGLWHPVAAVSRRQPSAADRIVEIKPTRGPKAVLTHEHEVWTSTGWMHAGELVGYRPGKKPFYVLPEPTPPIEKASKRVLQFRYHGYRSEIRLSPRFYRLLGFWVADGSLEPWTRRNAEPGYVTLGQKDRRPLEKYLETVHEFDPDAKVNGPYNNGIHILRFWHYGLWKWLYEHFTIPLSKRRERGRRRSRIAPLWLSGLRSAEFEAFWEGWDEGDGQHSADRNSSAVGTSSSALAGTMYTVLRARGIPASISVSFNRRFRSFKVAWLSANYANYGNVQPLTSTCDDGYLYDLEVEGEDSYALPGFFVHNSKLMGEMALNAYHREYGLKASSVRIFTCFHPDTRVLTPEGLRVISEFQIGDEVYTLNPETHEIEVSRVLATQKIPFLGKIVRIQHESVDWTVTPDHRMYYHPYRRRKCEFREASELLRKTGYQRMTAFHKPYSNGLHPSLISLWPYVDENHIVVVTPQNPAYVALARLQELGHERRPWTNKVLMKKAEVGDPVAFEEKYHCRVTVRDHLTGCKEMPFRFPTEAFIQLLGWYITEGSVRRKRYAQISISQSARVHSDHRSEIVRVLISMGIPYSEGKRDISFSSRMLRNFIEKEVGMGSAEKRIPDLIFDLDLSYRRLFFDTLMKGDGDISGRRYTTKSPKLAEDFQHLAFLNGVNIGSVRKDDNGHFRISIRPGKHSSIKSKHVSQVNYDGLVYCVTTDKNHIIYAGGRSLNWIGQCYGERENETHAIIALIAKTLAHMDPFEIWGTGDQDRNFTYVGDIVDAMLLAAEKIEDASPVNAGRADRITLNQAAETVFKLVDWRPQKTSHDLSKPVGVASRAADLTRAKKLLGWQPKVSYEDGFKRTIDWYRSHKNLEHVRRDLPRLLMER